MITAVNKTVGYKNGSFNFAETDLINPTANKLNLIGISVRNGASINPTITSVTGCGLTWEQVGTPINFDSSSSSRRTLFVFRALGASPTEGVLTITFGQTNTDATWLVDELSVINVTGTNGSNAIAQYATNKDESNSASSLNVALGSFESTDNATYGIFGTANDVDSHVAGSGFTIIGSAPGAGVNGLSTVSEFKNTNDTSVDMSFASGVQFGGIAIEIRAAPSSQVKKTSGVSQVNIKKMLSVEITSIKKISGVMNV